MGARVTLPVLCHSGYTYAQRPQQVLWESEWLDIREIIKEWYTPQGKGFQVVCKNQQILVLLYNEITEEWLIDEGFLPV